MKPIFNKILFGIALAFSVSASSAQTVTWDSTFRPPKYLALKKQFEEDKKSKSDIVFLGNSITAGTDWAKLLNLPEAKNRGIGGDITFGILERLQDVIDGKPKKVFILIGINDISRNIPDTVILANYKKIVERIRKGSKKTQIYFNTLLPVNASFAKFKNHYGKDDHILWLNDQIRKFTAKNVTVVDLYPNFLDAENHLKPEITKDGLHLLPNGYQIWAEFLHSTGYLK